jgi:hypothetical protein
MTALTAPVKMTQGNDHFIVANEITQPANWGFNVNHKELARTGSFGLGPAAKRVWATVALSTNPNFSRWACAGPLALATVSFLETWAAHPETSKT